MEECSKLATKKIAFILRSSPCTMNHMKTSAIMKPNDGFYLKAQKDLGNTSSNYKYLIWSVAFEYFTSYNSSFLCSAKMLSLVTAAVK